LSEEKKQRKDSCEQNDQTIFKGRKQRESVKRWKKKKENGTETGTLMRRRPSEKSNEWSKKTGGNQEKTKRNAPGSAFQTQN